MVQLIIDLLVMTLLIGFWILLGLVAVALVGFVYAFVCWFAEKMR